MEKEKHFGNNSRAQTLLKIFNHGFDADARRRAEMAGKNERDMFEGVIARLDELDINYSLEDVFLALVKAEKVHSFLLPPDRARAANESSARLLDYFTEHMDQNT